MAANNHNLWGELPDPGIIRTPRSILVEQAQTLSDLTKHVLIGEVETSTFKIEVAYPIRHSLVIVAPFLNNYRVTILTIAHHLNTYPLKYTDVINEPIYGGAIPSALDGVVGKTCTNENELEAALRQTLQSTKVRQVISALLAQSKDYPELVSS